MKPVSSRPLTTVPKAEQPALVQTSSFSIPIVPKQSSFKDAKQVRETNRPSRAGGGIFRSSGENIVYANGEKKKEKIPQAPATTGSELKSTTDHNKPAPVQSKTPMSLFNFTRSWECLASGTVAQRWSLLSVSPHHPDFNINTNYCANMNTGNFTASPPRTVPNLLGAHTARLPPRHIPV